MKCHLLKLLWLGCFSVLSLNAVGHNHEAMANKATTSKIAKVISCIDKSASCAKTVTTAFASNGDLWRFMEHESIHVLPNIER